MKRTQKIVSSTLALALTAALMAGCSAQSTAADPSPAEAEPTASPVAEAAAEETPAESTEADAAEVDIVNDYGNTAELLEKFPVTNPTPIETEMAQNIQNRLLTGFENWNRGYDAWEAWGDILYTEDSMYNVHGVRLTLKEYQMAMNATLSATDMQMGNFNNMVISGDWAAIRYDITSINRETKEENPGTVMEFVLFKDYGDELGTRVVEGWAGTKGADYDSLTAMLSDEEKAAQQAELEARLNATIPDTADLAEKYPVVYPTPIEGELAEKIQQAILQDFDHWNQGYDAWSSWADGYYTADSANTVGDGSFDLAQYKEQVKEQFDANTQRICFENMIISGDWAAIHYRTLSTDPATGEKTAGTVMQFLHFAEDGDTVRVVESWTK